MVERTQIDRVIAEQGFQRSSLTEAQMVRIGEILNLSMIVIGDINVVAGEYNVDARVVNVESGVIIATDGESFRGSYRESMKKLANRLAGQVAIKPGQTVQAAPKPKPAPSRTTPFVILGYLKVFPNDLGKFDSEPSSVIRQINSQEQHGYNTWRLPTSEELSLMVANSVVSSSDAYMTSDSHRSGLVRLVTDKGTAEEEKKNQSCDSTPIKFPCKDSATNYMWSSRSSNKMNWQSAINYCQNLTEGGYSDWRLPNIDELRTLIQNHPGTVTGGTCPISEKAGKLAGGDWNNNCDDKYVNNFSKLGDKGWFWSSSTLSDLTHSAWSVYFNFGLVNFSDKGYYYYVRCVR